MVCRLWSGVVRGSGLTVIYARIIPKKKPVVSTGSEYLLNNYFKHHNNHRPQTTDHKLTSLPAVLSVSAPLRSHGKWNRCPSGPLLFGRNGSPWYGRGHRNVRRLSLMSSW